MIAIVSYRHQRNQEEVLPSTGGMGYYSNNITPYVLKKLEEVLDKKKAFMSAWTNKGQNNWSW